MKKTRYNANTALRNRVKANLRTALVIPSLELEEETTKWIESIRAFFTEEQISEFMQIRSYQQFCDHCEKHDLVKVYHSPLKRET